MGSLKLIFHRIITRRMYLLRITGLVFLMKLKTIFSFYILQLVKTALVLALRFLKVLWKLIMIRFSLGHKKKKQHSCLLLFLKLSQINSKFVLKIAHKNSLE